MSFSDVSEEDDWALQSLASGMMIKEEFYTHHLQVVTSAIRSARSKSVAVNTFSLLDFDLHDRRRIPDLDTLSESLRQLLEHTKTMHLCASDCVLQLLSHSKLNSRQLDICRAVAADKVFLGFLESWARHG